MESSERKAPPSIEGWLHETAGELIDNVLQTQRLLGIKGNSLEIGVYMGKTLAHFVIDRNQDEKTIGVDTFSIYYPQKRLHEDILPKASENIKALNDYYDISGETLLIRGRSQDQSVLSQVKGMSFRVASIDGGHSFNDCVQDLDNYSRVITHDGAMIVDDFCNPVNPDVTAAIYSFLNSESGRDWRIAYGVTPLCSPAEASTRIVLTKKNYFSKYAEYLNRLFQPLLQKGTYQLLPKNNVLDQAFPLIFPGRYRIDTTVKTGP